MPGFSDNFHQPVMLAEALAWLAPRPGECYADCNLGGGGHALELARRIMPGGEVLGIDADELAISHAVAAAKTAGISNLTIKHDNFVNFKTIAKEYLEAGQRRGFAGILFDLGLSLAQLQDQHRGFSFNLDAPLNMAFGVQPAGSHSTQEIVNHYPFKRLENVIAEYGEERFAGKIAREICEVRKKELIATSADLVETIKRAVPSQYQHGRIHFATRTFQALRIETNQELDVLKVALEAATEHLKPQGRLVVIAYHSLEDRIVKHFFKDSQKLGRLIILTKKPVCPDIGEIKSNRRSRSAKLRAASSG